MTEPRKYAATIPKVKVSVKVHQGSVVLRWDIPDAFGCASSVIYLAPESAQQLAQTLLKRAEEAKA